ncbi:MAG: hypothetical protein J6Z11_12680, partial [Candidatus Riflebacteria bacterium]|nr:hypothetical protein [Candidatus Riflebacteria bacterium]
MVIKLSYCQENNLHVLRHPSVRRSSDTSATRSHPVARLHADLHVGSPQVEALENSRPRIIFSTNIAETSLTIEGITTVIDTGYARQNRFNPETGLNKLEMVRISKASAKQRAGRAGRLKAGRAIRLYSKAEFENFAENEIPEILRSDPTSSILELYSWGIKDPFKFNWLESQSKE